MCFCGSRVYENSLLMFLRVNWKNIPKKKKKNTVLPKYALIVTVNTVESDLFLAGT